MMVVLVSIVVAATAIGLAADRLLDFSSEEFEDVIRSWGIWGVLGSMGLMVLHSFVPFPAELIGIANGMIYGPFWGIIVTWAGAMIGALLTFGLARTLGRPFVERVVAYKDWRALDDWGAKHGGRVVLLARFVPVVAFNLINYAAGLSRISWWTFLWTTAAGILPLTILVVVAGDQIRTLSWWIWFLVVVVIGGCWYGIRRRLKRPKSP